MERFSLAKLGQKAESYGNGGRWFLEMPPARGFIPEP
jgi:hypothetical protein